MSSVDSVVIVAHHHQLTVGGSEAFFFRYLFMIDKNSGHFCSLSGRSRQHIQHAHDLMREEKFRWSHKFHFLNANKLQQR
jgi:hypothetical protein